MKLFNASSNGASTMASNLTSWERDRIAEWLAEGISKTKIAWALGRDVSSIRRECKRNGGGSGYHATEAQRKCEARQCAAHQKRRKMSSPEIRAFVIKGLTQEWSPDQIAGRLRRDFPGDSRRNVSRQTIYNWLHRRGREYLCHLRRYGKGRRRPPRAEPWPGLDKRAAEINNRVTCGHWEGDLIVSAGHVHAALLTLVERQTGYTEMVPVSRRKADIVGPAIVERLRKLPPHVRRSLTFDNGSEFSGWQLLVETLQVEVFFAHPHSPWERGTNENTNGLIRQYFDKGTRFDSVSPLIVQFIQDKLNDRPRKRLNYQTPNEVFSQQRYRAIQT
jgi:IS30 family transposase